MHDKGFLHGNADCHYSFFFFFFKLESPQVRIMVCFQGCKLTESWVWEAVKGSERQSFLKSKPLKEHDSSLCLTGKPDLPSMSAWKFVVWNLILCNLCHSNPFDKWHLRQRAYFFVSLNHKNIFVSGKWFLMSKVGKQYGCTSWQVFI